MLRASASLQGQHLSSKEVWFIDGRLHVFLDRALPMHHLSGQITLHASNAQRAKTCSPEVCVPPRLTIIVDHGRSCYQTSCVINPWPCNNGKINVRAGPLSVVSTARSGYFRPSCQTRHDTMCSRTSIIRTYHYSANISHALLRQDAPRFGVRREAEHVLTHIILHVRHRDHINARLQIILRTSPCPITLHPQLQTQLPQTQHLSLMCFYAFGPCSASTDSPPHNRANPRTRGASLSPINAV